MSDWGQGELGRWPKGRRRRKKNARVATGVDEAAVVLERPKKDDPPETSIGVPDADGAE